MYSTSYASGIPGMMSTFHISNETVVVLGITTYLFGMAVGSVILAPLSEMYGRRPIYICALACFTILCIPCALAPNIEAILITRFFGAFCGSAMVSNAPGTVSDIISDEYRALAFSIWSIGPMNGPVIGPLVGGFVFESLGWRWTNWVVMIGAGLALCMILSFKETYAPAILRSKAKKKRKETGEEKWYSRYDEKKEFWPLLKVNLSRPFIMTVTEPIWYVCFRILSFGVQLC
jgi:multidrug resistance protein